MSALQQGAAGKEISNLVKKSFCLLIYTIKIINITYVFIYIILLLLTIFFIDLYLCNFLTALIIVCLLIINNIIIIIINNADDILGGFVWT